MKSLLVRGQRGHDVAKRQEELNARCGAQPQRHRTKLARTPLRQVRFERRARTGSAIVFDGAQVI